MYMLVYSFIQMYIKVYTVIYLYVPMLRRYKYLTLSSAFHAYGHLWIYDLMGTYAMVQLSMGVWSRWSRW